MMLRDARDLPVTAADATSVDLLDGAIAAYLGARTDARERLDAALGHDPGCALAHCFDGYLSMLGGTGDTARAARTALDRGVEAARLAPLSDRERGHLAALDAWSGGDWWGATARWREILGDHPRDALAIRISQFVLSYLGQTEAMLDVIERVRPAWDESLPGFGFVLGCEAYAREEAGQYRAAEAAGLRAVELNREDIWAAHAVAHVREMEGRLDEGIRWIESLTGYWTACGGFAGHLRWHEALYRLEQEDRAGALACYDRDVVPGAALQYLDVVNGASLLWRLEQAGVEAGARWETLARWAREHAAGHVFVFADVHYLMALEGAGDRAESARFLASCERFAAGEGTEAGIMGEVGLPLLHAVVAHRRGRYDEAVERLLPVRGQVRRIGGSHAQRDLFEQLLIDAASRAGRDDLAARLLAERVAARPGNRWGWAHYARVLDRLGDSGADQARRALDRLRAGSRVA